MSAIRLLLVDDESEFLDLMRKRLSRRNVELTVASGGEEALALAATQRFDVIVLDVRMPGMDGLEILERLRSVDHRAEVLLLTGHASVESARKGLELGAFDYLLKPVPINEFLFRIQDACQRSRLRAGRG
ncbi:response regulator [Desulfocurvus sp.]|jgi:DNA-binding response OmpR family regulator|uniref:response regulator n=1 Tax=Desulfocurvus sp. TaxID=2871698 RepID=UPI0025C573FE|nr:response regulator [Desulfocurvus sp.]MCK9239730.1 response regulator [Desulfocurvus sp.]